MPPEPAREQPRPPDSPPSAVLSYETRLPRAPRPPLSRIVIVSTVVSFLAVFLSALPHTGLLPALRAIHIGLRTLFWASAGLSLAGIALSVAGVLHVTFSRRKRSGAALALFTAMMCLLNPLMWWLGLMASGLSVFVSPF